MVVVFLFTKPMVTLLARTKFFGQGHPLSGLDPARLGARAPWRSTRTTRVRARRPDEGGMMSRLGNFGGRLYRGEVSFDFVGRQKLWYTISGLILLLSLIGLFGRGLNFSVDFKGGSVITTPGLLGVLDQARCRARSAPPATARAPSSSTSARAAAPPGRCRRAS